MRDTQAHLEKLRFDAAECAGIGDLADSEPKRELFAHLARHLTVLATEIEREIAATRSDGETVKRSLV